MNANQKYLEGVAKPFFILVLLLILISPSYGLEQNKINSDVWVGNYLRGGEHILSKAEKVNESFDFSNMQLLKDSTMEFGNSNTFVRLFEEGRKKSKINLAFKKIVFFADSKLSANQAMELMFKISAARSQLTSRIEVFFPHGTNLKNLIIKADGRKLVLPFDEYLVLSGADAYWLGNKKISLEKKTFVQATKVTADKEFVVSGDLYPTFASKLASELAVPYLSLNEILKKSRGAQKIKRVYLVAPPISPCNESIFKTLEDMKRLKEKNIFVNLVSPYLPYARSDKAEFEYGVGPQGKLIVELLEASGMGAMTIVRPHAPQSISFFKVPVIEVTGRETINAFLKNMDEKIDLVISPDAGFQKDATKYAQELNVPVLVINKQRSISGESKLINVAGLQQADGKNVVIIDDETETGGTLSKVAKLLKESSSVRKVYTVVTHLAGSAKAVIKSPDVDALIYTNTFPNSGAKSDKKIMLSIEKEVAQKIKEIENI